MRSLTILSTDKNASIQIERREFEQFVNYAVTASFHGERVTNEGVVFTHTSAFVRSLEVFERSRAGAPLLDGTEDCKLTIEADGQMGHAWLTFQVSRTLHAFSAQTGRGRSGRITLSGSFSVSGEFIGQLVFDFRELFGEHEARAS